MTTLRRLPLLLAAPALAGLLALGACSAPGQAGSGQAGSAPENHGTTTPASPAPGGASAGDQSADAAGDAAAILAAAGLKDVDAADPEAVVEALEAIPVAERPEGLAASVTAGAVRLRGADGAEASLPLQRFYLSVAPFVSTTHECTFHAPVGCKGEQANASARFTITDADTGEVLVNEEVSTADNGFAGFWLPADRRVTVTATVGGKSGEVTTGTGADDPTCLTTLRLS
ncbi:CueP family metal-binding protein [Galactobacter valiniphilus]|uniref:CueP family metal-binding protein n=1 Tax=Galactobacter valiniphilus TaxID=2676122 RepID=UPI0037352820